MDERRKAAYQQAFDLTAANEDATVAKSEIDAIIKLLEFTAEKLLPSWCVMTANTPIDRLSDAQVHAIVEHCLAHGDKALPPGVLAVATSNQLDSVAKMLDHGGFHADARDLRRYARVYGGNRDE